MCEARRWWKLHPSYLRSQPHRIYSNITKDPSIKRSQHFLLKPQRRADYDRVLKRLVSPKNLNISVLNDFYATSVISGGASTYAENYSGQYTSIYSFKSFNQKSAGNQAVKVAMGVQQAGITDLLGNEWELDAIASDSALYCDTGNTRDIVLKIATKLGVSRRDSVGPKQYLGYYYMLSEFYVRPEIAPSTQNPVF